MLPALSRCGFARCSLSIPVAGGGSQHRPDDRRHRVHSRQVEASARELAILHDILRRVDGAEPGPTQVAKTPLRGGLEAAAVERLSLQYVDAAGRERRRAMVAKRLEGFSMREAAIYQRFVAGHAEEFAPRLHHVDSADPGEAVLYLEALHPVSTWPWREQPAAQSVLDLAAQLHACNAGRDAMAVVAEWDYEMELQHTARRTLECLEQVRRQPALWSFGGALRWTRRVVSALPALRHGLLQFEPFGSTVIHGDLHPGNVVLRRRDGERRPVLLDWGRARLGSPLEDVSCWLQSLGAWEPEARRRHDTLLVGYLAACGIERPLDREIRAGYWLAGASNALSGALLYHLSVLLDDSLPSRAHASAAYSAREWVRVLRRADSYWC